MEKFTTEGFKVWLTKEPLYKKTSFLKPSEYQTLFGISEIDSFCDKCQSLRPFHEFKNKNSYTMDRPAGFTPTYPIEYIHTYEFTCVSCKTECRTFFANVIVEQQTVSIEKVGETPRQKIDRDKQLEKFFKCDLENYNKAVVCLSHGYGVGAFAYMRRIIEDNIENLIELISEELTSVDNNQELITALNELRKESPMSEKIKIANKALPNYLQPNGLNPLGRLYRILSEGVHKLPDSECLEKAKNLKACIKYLISEISTRKENRNNFKTLINEM